MNNKHIKVDKNQQIETLSPQFGICMFLTLIYMYGPVPLHQNASHIVFIIVVVINMTCKLLRGHKFTTGFILSIGYSELLP